MQQNYGDILCSNYHSPEVDGSEKQHVLALSNSAMTWFNLLAWIIDGDYLEQSMQDQGRVVIKAIKTKQLILSIAQDILPCARHGQVKTPKHVLLPLAVEHYTRSAKVVTLLNRFEHTM